MLQFVREIPLRIVMHGASSERRGFLFYMSAGFSKELNPLSGMTVNLVQVDEWLGELKNALEKDVLVSKTENLSHAFAELMAIARLYLVEKAESEQATLISLSFREERAWSFFWDHNLSPEEMNFRYVHFLEAFPKTQDEFDLLKIEFSWRRVQGCETDFRHEGFKILKDLSIKNHVELRERLQGQVGLRLESGSDLSEVVLHYLSSDSRISLS